MQIHSEAARFFFKLSHSEQNIFVTQTCFLVDCPDNLVISKAKVWRPLQIGTLTRNLLISSGAFQWFAKSSPRAVTGGPRTMACRPWERRHASSRSCNLRKKTLELKQRQHVFHNNDISGARSADLWGADEQWHKRTCHFFNTMFCFFFGSMGREGRGECAAPISHTGKVAK